MMVLTGQPTAADELPASAAERRKIQNRIAQRKFRQKRTLKRRMETAKQVQNVNSGPGIQTPTEQDFPTMDNITGPSDFQFHPSFNLSNSAGNNNDGQILDDSFLSFWENPGSILDEGLLSTPSLSSGGSIADSSASSQPDYTHGRAVDLLPGNTAVQTSQDDLILSKSAPDRRRGRSGSNATIENWLTATHIAAEKGHVRILEMLLARPGACVNDRDGEGKTALIYATKEQHADCIRALLARGAKVDGADNVTGWTSMHWAVLNRNLPILNILLEHGSKDSEHNVDAWDVSGWTALHAAVECGFEEGVSLLMQYGADLSFRARRCRYTGLVTPRQLEDMCRIALRTNKNLHEALGKRQIEMHPGIPYTA